VWGQTVNYPIIHRDYETRSEVDLKKVGAHVYAKHPSTRILCAVWIVETEKGKFDIPEIWEGDPDYLETGTSVQPMPEHIRKLIQDGAVVCGHNAAFEQAIDEFMFDCVPFDWPSPKLEQLDCTMARAAVQGLPLDLESLAAALDMAVRKDLTGHRLMLQMCKPRARQKDEPKGIYWNYDALKMERLIRYCVTDVRTEIAVGSVLRSLQEQERPVWELDQLINNRGVEIDLDFIRTVKTFIERATLRANKRLKLVTGGAIDKVSQIERLKDFAKWRGVEFKTTTKRNARGDLYLTDAADKEAIEDLLELEDEDVVLPGKPNEEWQEGDEPSVRAAFQLRIDAGKSSLRKLDKFLWQAPEGRSRGNLQFHAAGPGRWSGRGIQMQNLVRAGITEPGGWDAAFRAIKKLTDEEFEMVWGSPFDVVSRMMRGALIAAPGKRLIYADYSNVEARGCVWAAGQMDMVKLFAEGGLIYETMGEYIFGIPAEEILRLHKTGENKIPRFVAKETVLGCGYGMGWMAFQRNCKKKGRIILEDDLCQKGIEVWRERNSEVVKLWYRLGDAARHAIESPETVFEAGPFAFRKVGKWLQLRLPSGRIIWYRRPHFRPADDDLENYDAKQGVPRDKWKIHFYGVNSITKQWCRETMWGGKILENGVQGLCRDFLAGAMLRLEHASYPIVLSVHDEIIAEVSIGVGSVEQFVALMTELPSWGSGFPLVAEGGEGQRYAKA
jgi:DNA polymerase bacteriophage-type